MRYLFDTNAVIALLKGQPALTARVRSEHPGDIGLSALVAHELYYGAFKSVRREANVGVVDSLQFEILDFDSEDARHAGEIRALLAQASTPIGPYDVLIAGQARARGLTLVTHNTSEFGRVAGLALENWQA